MSTNGFPGADGADVGGGGGIDLDAITALLDNPDGGGGIPTGSDDLPEGGDGGEGGAPAGGGNANLRGFIQATKAQLEAAQRETAQLKEQMEALRNSGGGQQPPAYVPPGGGGAPGVDPQQLNEKLGAILMNNPGQFAQMLIAAATMSAQNAAGGAAAPVNQRFALNQLDMFRQTALTQDPPEVRAKFEELVKRELQTANLSTLTPDQISAGLTALRKQAYGETVMEKRTSRQNQPPLYAVGDGGGANGATSYKANRQLSAVERQMVQNAKDYGFTDKEIDELLASPGDE